MKRPLFSIGFSFFLSIFFATALHITSFQTFIIFFVVFGILIILKKRGYDVTEAIAVTLSFSIGLFIYAGVTKAYILPLINEFDNKQITFTGVVDTVPYQNDNSLSFVVKTDTVNNSKRKIKFTIYFYGKSDINYSDKIEGCVTLSSNYKPGYNSSAYNRANKIFFSCSSSRKSKNHFITSNNNNKPITFIFYKTRQYISSIFQEYMDSESSSICSALITGEKSQISYDTRSSFKKVGISHVLAVSGLHFSIVIYLVNFITEKILGETRLAAIMRIALLFLYGLMTGFGFSVKRTFIMVTVWMFGKEFGFKADSLNSLGLAALILSLNPLNISDMGLVWSVCCTASILLFAETITESTEEFFNIKDCDKIQMKFLHYLIGSFAVSFSAFIGSLPLSIIISNDISIYTVLVNVFISPLVGIAVFCGIIGTLFHLAKITIVAGFIMSIDKWAVILICKIVDYFSQLWNPNFYVNFSASIIFFEIMFCIIILDSTIERFRKKLIIHLMTLVGIFCILIGCIDLCNHDKILFYVVDGGNGITAIVSYNSNSFIIDSFGEKGRYSDIKNELKRKNDISYIFDMPPTGVTPKYSYFERITKDFPVKKVLCNGSRPDDSLYENLKLNESDVIEIKKINYTAVFDKMDVNLQKGKKCTWKNIKINNTNILICPSGADMNELDNSFLKYDFIVMNKIPKNYIPKNDSIAIVSASGDNCQKILTQLDNMGVSYIETNGKGTIKITIDNNNLSIEQLK